MMSSHVKEALPNPVKIVKELDKYIIGQVEAKQTLALMLLNRALLKLHRNKKIRLVNNPQKANVLLIGPTGTGKTSLVKALSEISDIPITIADVTQITKAGYIGGKVEDVLINHVNNCAEHVDRHFNRLVSSAPGSMLYTTRESLIKEAVETGIIYLDEIDKLKFRSEKPDLNEGVQDELLKILERGDVSLSDVSKYSHLPSCGIRSVVTDNIFFICGGAFSGLKDIVADRLKEVSPIGFGSNPISRSAEAISEHLMKRLTTDDLVKYGLKPEFLGRIPLRANLNPLDIESMRAIITVSKNSLYDQYTEMFRLFGIKLVCGKETIDAIAKKALSLEMGARSLQSIFNKVLQPEMFNIFSYKKKFLKITKEHVEERCKTL